MVGETVRLRLCTAYLSGTSVSRKPMPIRLSVLVGMMLLNTVDGWEAKKVNAIACQRNRSGNMPVVQVKILCTSGAIGLGMVWVGAM